MGVIFVYHIVYDSHSDCIKGVYSVRGAAAAQVLYIRSGLDGPRGPAGAGPVDTELLRSRWQPGRVIIMELASAHFRRPEISSKKMTSTHHCN